MKIRTREDARCLVENSGVLNFQWDGGASLEGLTDYVYRHGFDVDYNAFQALLANYLLSVGERPRDYGLPPPRLHGPAGDFRR